MVWKALILLLLFLPFAYSLECNHSSEPYIKQLDKIDWLCTVESADNASNCLSYVRFGQEYIQVNPDRQAISDYGVQDSFEVHDNLVNVFFTKQDLRHNRTVVFGVVCGNATYESNVTPMYKDPLLAIDRFAWTAQNMTFFVGAILLLLVIFGLMWLLIKQFGGFGT